MSLITASNLSRSFGARDIFRNISLSIPHQARIALVGANGIGKTTLLRILAGEDTLAGGEVYRARNLRIGYLPQEMVPFTAEVGIADETASASNLTITVAGGGNPKRTLWQECLSAFDDLRDLEARLIALEKDMATLSRSGKGQEELDVLLRSYGNLQAEFEHRGGYTYPTRIRQVLSGLGFSEDEHDYPLTQLSGGQRTRAYLAHLLLADPQLLILDEPTNHLDVTAIEWLEGYLSQWKGAAVIVSHDRYFLDRTCNMVWEMYPTHLELYHGNYSAYLHQRQERWDLRQQQFQAEKERLEKEIAYVKRYIAGQNTTQAVGRLRRLSRMVEAIEQLGFDGVQGKQWLEISRAVDTSTSMMHVEEAERRIRALQLPSNRPPQMRLDLRSQQRSGNIVLRASNLEVGFVDGKTRKLLFKVPQLELRRLECAALIGPNGAGKTTFLKTILGLLPPLRGELSLGASLQIGYFAQGREDLSLENTLVEEVESVAPHMLPAQVRNYLARFLFTEDEVFKQVKALSGGERGRLALAKLALQDTNLLLLDEPTNHLDIPSQEILEVVLSEYQGTIILVTHDRYLIDRLATQIWEIVTAVPFPYLRVFSGSYSQYRTEFIENKIEGSSTAMAVTAIKSPQVEQQKATVESVAVEVNDHRTTQADYRQKARLKNRLQAEKRRRQALLEELEQQISENEGRLEALARQLESPPSDLAEVHRLGEEYLRLQDTLKELYQAWEQLI